MAVYIDPVTQSRRLRTRLRQLRSQRDLTQETVASMLDWSTAKVLRIESGTVSVSITDLRALLGVYDVTDPGEIDELVDLAREARRRPWAAAYKDLWTPEFYRYVGYEASAARVMKVESQLVPGLLQTKEYAEAVMQALAPVSPPDAPDIQRRVEARLRRQEELFGKPRPKMAFVLDEAVVRRVMGGPRVMADQLRHLQEMASSPDLTIQIVPFGKGATSSLQGPFTILEFDQADLDTVLFIETPRGDLITFEDQETVTSYHARFLELEGQATKADRFQPIIDKVIGDMQAGMFSLDGGTYP